MSKNCLMTFRFIPSKEDLEIVYDIREKYRSVGGAYLSNYAGVFNNSNSHYVIPPQKALNEKYQNQEDAFNCLSDHFNDNRFAMLTAETKRPVTPLFIREKNTLSVEQFITSLRQRLSFWMSTRTKTEF